MSPTNSSHPRNLSLLSPSDAVLQTALHSMLCCIAKSDSVPYHVEKRRLGVRELVSRNLSKVLSGVTGAYGVQYPQTKRVLPHEPRHLTEMNFVDQKPNALVDTLTTFPIVWLLQCTQYTSICSSLGMSQRVECVSSLCVSPYPFT